MPWLWVWVILWVFAVWWYLCCLLGVWLMLVYVLWVLWVLCFVLLFLFCLIVVLFGLCLVGCIVIVLFPSLCFRLLLDCVMGLAWGVLGVLMFWCWICLCWLLDGLNLLLFVRYCVCLFVYSLFRYFVCLLVVFGFDFRIGLGYYLLVVGVLYGVCLLVVLLFELCMLWLIGWVGLLLIWVDCLLPV